MIEVKLTLEQVKYLFYKERCELEELASKFVLDFPDGTGGIYSSDIEIIKEQFNKFLNFYELYRECCK